MLDDAIVLSTTLRDRLLEAVSRRHPRKSFGYLLSEGSRHAPGDFLLFETNLRNEGSWKPRFEHYGPYFTAHADAGFVASPEETWRRQKEIWSRGMQEVGVFHSHQRHPGNFSRIDYDMHMERFEELWHLIVSMRNPASPQLRAFAPSRSGVRELQVRIEGRPADQEPRPAAPAARDAAISLARSVLRRGPGGRPRVVDARAAVAAVDGLLRLGDQDVVRELLLDGFLRGSAQRYEDHVAPHMRGLGGGRFEMGTDPADAGHFSGEMPRHLVELSPFQMARVPVTTELLGLFDPDRAAVSPRERATPVRQVSWWEASLFAMWMGCRLPTEAEWELACGAGSKGQWCCDDERELGRYAWYCQNSGDEVQPVGTREPNAFGLSDLHGNVWEWCQDTYDQDYFAYAPTVDPVNLGAWPGEPAPYRDKVTRGGSMNALAEMCRTSYRFHEPPEFRSADLGFRLVRAAGLPPR